MSVAHDNVSESHTGTTGAASVASFTWNHVPTGTPRSALVFTLAIGANPVTGVTYGGTSMTAVPYTAYDSDTEPGFVQAWFLDNVASGTQAVVVNRTNNAVVTYATCMTQTAASACEVYDAGVKTIAAAGTEQTAASSSATGVSSSWSSMTLDDGSPGTNSQRYLAVHSGASSVSAASTNTTTNGTNASIDFGLYVFFTMRETTPSQGAKALTIATAISDDLAVIGLAVREVASTPKTGTDSGTATDASTSTTAALTSTESGAGAEASVNIGLTGTAEAGTATDTAVNVAIPVVASDSGAGGDVSVGVGITAAAEQGTGADAVAAKGSGTVEAGVGAETSGIGLFGSDSGTSSP